MFRPLSVMHPRLRWEAARHRCSTLMALHTSATRSGHIVWQGNSCCTTKFQRTSLHNADTATVGVEYRRGRATQTTGRQPHKIASPTTFQPAQEPEHSSERDGDPYHKGQFVIFAVPGDFPTSCCRKVSSPTRKAFHPCSRYELLAFKIAAGGAGPSSLRACVP